MNEVMSPYDVVTDNYKAKRHIAMRLLGVASEKDVEREIAQMSERGTTTVLINNEQYARLMTHCVR